MVDISVVSYYMSEKLKPTLNKCVIREKSVLIPVNREFFILIPVNRARHLPPPPPPPPPFRPSCINVFDRDRNFVYKFGKQGHGKGKFNGPRCLSANKLRQDI